MKSHPEYITLDRDHVIVRVVVSVPWLNETMNYQHVFDSPGLQEEFGVLPPLVDPFQIVRRRELMEKRARTAEMVAASITRSLLDAVAREPK